MDDIVPFLQKMVCAKMTDYLWVEGLWVIFFFYFLFKKDLFLRDRE